MRKKLLRSRSGFEKPESREEAIMQNILGASNVLEPSESNIEEILKSILYNTPYTKEAEFEIEKILLAIKNNGTYDGEGKSRDTKILIAILNDLDYTEEAESRIEELFIEWLHQRSSIKVLEGVPPLTFTSRGLPLINYLIEGNTIQNGTPTPDDPIMPQGTGERTWNLLNPNITRYEKAYSDRIVDFSGGAMYIVPIKSNTTYTIKTYSDEGIEVFRIGLYNKPVPESGDTVDNIVRKSGLNPTATITNTDYEYLMIQISGAYINNYGLADTVLNEGSEPLPREPYGYKIPISSAGQTTPVYLGEVESTRKVKKLVLDGTENWAISGAWKKTNTSVFYFPVSGIGGTSDYERYILSTHFVPKSRTELYQDDIEGIGKTGSNSVTVRVDDTIATTVNDFKAWLRDNNVTVWYVLATEETGIVNEPLMKIGDYADTLSMEQAGVEIPTNNGSTTLDVDTTVKPSNIYIEYK